MNPNITVNLRMNIAQDINSIFEEIYNLCEKTTHLVVDVDQSFSEKLCSEFTNRRPEIIRAVYVDNFMNFVPGDYSEKLDNLVRRTHMVLTANINPISTGMRWAASANADFSNYKKVGIGLFPMDEAEKIVSARKQAPSIRQSIFTTEEIKDSGQSIFTYLGGVNDTCFRAAFLLFLQILEELAEKEDHPLAKAIIVFQQHPREKANNGDAKELADWKRRRKNGHYPEFRISRLPIDQSLAVSQGVIYHQTSLFPQMVKAGIPYIIQVDPASIDDIALQATVVAVKNGAQLEVALSEPSLKLDRKKKKKLEEGLGISKNWQSNLLSAFKYRFTHNAYYQTLIESKSLKNDVEVELFINRPPLTDDEVKVDTLTFCYGNVDLENYSKNYQSRRWFARKIIAVPAALYAILFKTIYHLAKAFFCCAGKESGYVLKNLFFCLRDFQESFAWVLTIFNDRVGSYHRQDSLFQKECYAALHSKKN